MGNLKFSHTERGHIKRGDHEKVLHFLRQLGASKVVLNHFLAHAPPCS